MNWTESQLTEISTLWQDGVPARVIADMYNVSVKEIWRCSENNREFFPKRVGVKSYCDDQLQRAAQMWNSGHSATVIANEISVSIAVVYNMRKSNKALFTRKARSKHLSYLSDRRSCAVFEEKEIKLKNVLPIIVVPLPFSKAVDEKRCLYFAADVLSHEGVDMPVCGMQRMKGIRQPYCEQHYQAMRYIGGSDE